MSLSPYITLELDEDLTKIRGSGVARAFRDGRLTHSEDQNEEENLKTLRKNEKNWSKFEEKWGKLKSCPPGTVRLAVALIRKSSDENRFLVCTFHFFLEENQMQKNLKCVRYSFLWWKSWSNLDQSPISWPDLLMIFIGSMVRSHSYWENITLWIAHTSYQVEMRSSNQLRFNIFW